MKGYRKIKYFSEREAENLCDKLNGDNRRSNMVCSSYITEQIMPGQWVVSHYVMRDLCSQRAKNGLVPWDQQPNYKEGYIWNG